MVTGREEGGQILNSPFNRVSQKLRHNISCLPDLGSSDCGGQKVGGRMGLRFLERRELLLSPPNLPREEDGEEEETELGEIRVLAQGHTAGG